MNVCPAAFAAAMREGSTSTACIEREPSMIIITVARSIGTATVDCGRASAPTRAMTASARSAAGRRRRQAAGRGATAVIVATAGKRTAQRRRRRRASV